MGHVKIREKKPQTTEIIGFVALYKGKQIASATTFKELANKANVKAHLGDKDLIIKHSVPEGLIAIY